MSDVSRKKEEECLKILSGKFKGRNFYRPAEIRPTQNLTRKAVFDIIGHDLAKVEFLDLFAGSGAVGLEALSLGAKKVIFVEKNVRNAEILTENLQLFGLEPYDREEDVFEVINSDVFVTIKLLAKQQRKFNVIFLDPPYGRGLVKKALKTLMAYDIVHPDCYIIIEHNKYDKLPEQEDLAGNLSCFTQRRYGKSYLTILHKEAKTQGHKVTGSQGHKETTA